MDLAAVELLWTIAKGFISVDLFLLLMGTHLRQQQITKGKIKVTCSAYNQAQAATID